MVWLVVWHFWYEWYVCIFCLWCRCTSVPSVSGPVLFSTTTAPLSSESRSSPAIPCRVKLIKIRVKYRHASTQRKEQNFDVFGGYHTTTLKFQLLKANLWHPNTIISMLNSLILKSIFIAKRFQFFERDIIKILNRIQHEILRKYLFFSKFFRKIFRKSL